MAYSSSEENYIPQCVDEEDKINAIAKLTACKTLNDDKYHEKIFGELEICKYAQLMKPGEPELSKLAIASIEAALVAKGGTEGLTVFELSDVISDISDTWFTLSKIASILLPGNDVVRRNPEEILHHETLKDIVECVDGERYRLKKTKDNQKIVQMMETANMAGELHDMQEEAKQKDTTMIKKTENNDWIDANQDSESQEESTSNDQTDADLNYDTIQTENSETPEKVSDSAIVSSSEESYQLLSKPSTSGLSDLAKDHAQITSEDSNAAFDKVRAETKPAQPKMVRSIGRKGCYSDESEDEVSSQQTSEGHITDDEASSPPADPKKKEPMIDPIVQDLAALRKEMDQQVQEEFSTSPTNRGRPRVPEEQPRKAFFREPSPPIVLSSAPPSLVAKQLQHVPGMLHPIAKDRKDKEAREAREKKRQMDLENKRRQEELAAAEARRKAKEDRRKWKEDEDNAKRFAKMNINETRQTQTNEKATKGRFEQSTRNPQMGSSAFDAFNSKQSAFGQPFGQRLSKNPSPFGFDNQSSRQGFGNNAPQRRNRFNRSPNDESNHAAQVREKNEWFSGPTPQPQPKVIHPEFARPEIVKPVPTYGSSYVESQGYGRADPTRERQLPERRDPYQHSDLNQHRGRNMESPPVDRRDYRIPESRSSQSGFGGHEHYRAAEDIPRGSSVFSGFDRPMDRNMRMDPYHEQSYDSRQGWHSGFSDRRVPESDPRAFGRNDDDMYGSRSTLGRSQYEPESRATSSMHSSRMSSSVRSQYESEHSAPRTLIHENNSREARYDQRQPAPPPMRRDIPSRSSQPVIPQGQGLTDFIKAYMIMYAEQGVETEWADIFKRCESLNSKFRFKHPSEVYGPHYVNHLKTGLKPIIEVEVLGMDIIFGLVGHVYTGWDYISDDPREVFVKSVYDLLQGFEANKSIKWSLLREGLQLPAPESCFGENWPTELTRMAHDMGIPIKAQRTIHDVRLYITAT